MFIKIAIVYAKMLTRKKKLICDILFSQVNQLPTMQINFSSQDFSIADIGIFLQRRKRKANDLLSIFFSTSRRKKSKN